ncbi:MAG: hypothetical protein AUI36_21850 [Cyanobacteria bacterium 13_1_40CM_2_61_4]|nr:MAG: hypothetical protein AUI36_21850 [Cyanobacteria bacterium 13_1_40CM_2_61_4]
MWWRWTAATTGHTVFDTVGSNFDTVLTAYAGSVSSANLVGLDDDSGGNGTSRIMVSAFAGTTYYIAVTSYGSATGGIRLNWSMTATPVGGPTTQDMYHVFPQFADGRFSDGNYYRTTLMITNPSSTAGSNCTLQLRGLTVPGFSLNYTMGIGGWVISSTSGTQAFQSGYATLQCTTRVEAQLLYSFYAANGVKFSEATVFSSPAARTVQILSDSREGAQVGIALANDSDQVITYNIVVGDVNGNIVGSATQALAARSSIAKFVSEFVTLPSNHYGQVIVGSASGSVSIIGLRFTGSIFTTIPGTIR